MSPAQERALRQLARLEGIQLSYLSAQGQVQKASSETLLALLKALGTPINSPAEIPHALRAARHTRSQHLLEPVTVAWIGHQNRLTLRIPSNPDKRPRRFRITQEDGQRSEFTIPSPPAVRPRADRGQS